MEEFFHFSIQRSHEKYVFQKNHGTDLTNWFFLVRKISAYHSFVMILDLMTDLIIETIPRIISYIQSSTEDNSYMELIKI